MYGISGLTQQFVCPYIVSGRSVAQTRYTGLLPSDLDGRWIACEQYFDGLVHKYSNSSVLAMQLQLSCNKPSTGRKPIQPVQNKLRFESKQTGYLDISVQDCGNSSLLAMPQLCAKSSIWSFHHLWYHKKSLLLVNRNAAHFFPQTFFEQHLFEENIYTVFQNRLKSTEITK